MGIFCFLAFFIFILIVFLFSPSKKADNAGVDRHWKSCIVSHSHHFLIFVSWFFSWTNPIYFFLWQQNQQFDPEGFGEIPWEDFGRALRSPEFRRHIEPHKIQQLEEKFELQGCNDGDLLDDRPRRTSAITFQDFVNVVSRYFFIWFLWLIGRK